MLFATGFGAARVLVTAASLAMFLPMGARAQECGDVNGNGSLTSSDALDVLKAAVGENVELICSGECSEVEPRVTSLEAALAAATSQIAALETLLAGVTRTNNTITVSGANLQVVDGSGSTTGATNGLGNLIVGYNENTSARTRTGSHNLVIGIEHEYTSFGGIVAGEENAIAERAASVLGGKHNIAGSIHAVVVGGRLNVAAGDYSAVVGGSLNTASGNLSAVGGGFTNEASGLNSAVSGGCENQATNNFAAVSGGRLGEATAEFSSVQGGYLNKATGGYSSVSGGSTRTASTQFNWKAGSLSEAN
jgi:trimeric autotransporter adhesin